MTHLTEFPEPSRLAPLAPLAGLGHPSAKHNAMVAGPIRLRWTRRERRRATPRNHVFHPWIWMDWISFDLALLNTTAASIADALWRKCSSARVFLTTACGTLALAIWLLQITATMANDTTAQLSTGGLDFVPNPSVEMRSEELFVSMTQIRVTYHFFNNSDQPVTNLVAFPMPDVTFDNADAHFAIPTEDPVNFLGFSTTVNGQRVAINAEQTVHAKGINQTALLQKLGIPLAPQLEATARALDALPPGEWQHLIGLGLAEIDESFLDHAVIRHLQPRWTLKTTYYWMQTFPPGKDLIIAHQYKPSVGVSVGTEVGTSESPSPADYKTKYCTEPDFVAAAARAQQAARSVDKPFGEKRIDYILTTGANWAAPITDFTLTVDKGAPANLVSFCGTGVVKIAPTQFKVHYSNFTPTTDLGILILTTNVASGPGLSDDGSKLVTRVYVDDKGRPNEDVQDVRIVYDDGTDVIAPKEKDQATSTDPALADDRQTVGWLANYRVCSQSYPCPIALVIYRGEKITTKIEASNGIIWRWRFFDDGKQVGFSEGVTHGTVVPTDYRLYDVSTGSLIQEIPTADDKSPEWVRTLAHMDSQVNHLSRNLRCPRRLHESWGWSQIIRFRQKVVASEVC